MSAPVTFITTYPIKQGELDTFRRFLGGLLETLEANDPSALEINAYINQDGTEAAIVQVGEDPDLIKKYWRVLHQQTGRQLGRFVESPTSVHIYGPTGEIVLERTRHSLDTGVSVTVMPQHIGGFARREPATGERRSRRPARIRRLSSLAMAAVALGGVVIMRRLRGHAVGRHTPGGILIGNPGSYDAHSRLLFGSLFKGIASDIAWAARRDSGILEIGCGPGHLSVLLARDHDLDVTGLDLDPEMIERAQANAARTIPHGRRPSFLVGDVAALPFDDASFDLVISTFSLHHWSDPSAGLAEIARVLRTDGRVLIWDLKAGFTLFHAHAPDPAARVSGGPLRLVSARPWRWPWRIALAQRLELAQAE